MSRLHYGSIKEGASRDAIEAGSRAGNINYSDMNATTELAKSSMASKERHKELKEGLEKRKRARELAVPTNDNAVKHKLREFGEPICLFAEEAPERRERLRDVMAKALDVTLEQTDFGRLVPKGAKEPEKMADEPLDSKQELFYTEGAPQLHAARVWIARFSLEKAGERVASQKRKRDTPSLMAEDEAVFEKQKSELKSFSNQFSNFADDRPISSCAFSPDASMLVSGSWSSLMKTWKVPSCEQVSTLRGHTERVSGVAWHPQACISQSPTSCNLVSGGCDSMAKLWSLEGDRPIAELEGHADRLGRVGFHPSGRYVGTTSFDCTWRFWDVETQTTLLLQEGHSRAVYCISFQVDGALVATCGLDTHVRVWDTRSGKCIQAMQGHVKQVLGLDFSPNGFQLCSGSDDHTCRIWDLRRKRCLYTIPAHSALISDVKYHPNDGNFLATASYDMTCKLWSTKDFTLVKTLPGHEGRLMSLDFSRDGNYLATSAMDRTWKLWSM